MEAGGIFYIFLFQTRSCSIVSCPWRPIALSLHSPLVDASLLSDTVWTDAPLIVVGLSLSLGLSNQLSPWLPIELWPLSSSGEASGLAGISLSSAPSPPLSLFTPTPPPRSDTHTRTHFLAIWLCCCLEGVHSALLLSSSPPPPSLRISREREGEKKGRVRKWESKKEREREREWQQ